MKNIHLKKRIQFLLLAHLLVDRMFGCFPLRHSRAFPLPLSSLEMVHTKRKRKFQIEEYDAHPAKVNLSSL